MNTLYELDPMEELPQILKIAFLSFYLTLPIMGFIIFGLNVLIVIIIIEVMAVFVALFYTRKIPVILQKESPREIRQKIRQTDPLLNQTQPETNQKIALPKKPIITKNSEGNILYYDTNEQTTEKKKENKKKGIFSMFRKKSKYEKEVAKLKKKNEKEQKRLINEAKIMNNKLEKEKNKIKKINPESKEKQKEIEELIEKQKKYEEMRKKLLTQAIEKEEEFKQKVIELRKIETPKTEKMQYEIKKQLEENQKILKEKSEIGIYGKTHKEIEAEKMEKAQTENQEKIIQGLKTEQEMNKQQTQPKVGISPLEKEKKLLGTEKTNGILVREKENDKKTDENRKNKQEKIEVIIEENKEKKKGLFGFLKRNKNKKEKIKMKKIEENNKSEEMSEKKDKKEIETEKKNNKKKKSIFNIFRKSSNEETENKIKKIEEKRKQLEIENQKNKEELARIKMELFKSESEETGKIKKQLEEKENKMKDERKKLIEMLNQLDAEKEQLRMQLDLEKEKIKTKVIIQEDKTKEEELQKKINEEKKIINQEIDELKNRKQKEAITEVENDTILNEVEYQKNQLNELKAQLEELKQIREQKQNKLTEKKYMQENKEIQDEIQEMYQELEKQKMIMYETDETTTPEKINQKNTKLKRKGLFGKIKGLFVSPENTKKETHKKEENEKNKKNEKETIKIQMNIYENKNNKKEEKENSKQLRQWEDGIDLESIDENYEPDTQQNRKNYIRQKTDKNEYYDVEGMIEAFEYDVNENRVQGVKSWQDQNYDIIEQMDEKIFQQNPIQANQIEKIGIEVQQYNEDIENKEVKAIEPNQNNQTEIQAEEIKLQPGEILIKVKTENGQALDTKKIIFFINGKKQEPKKTIENKAILQLKEKDNELVVRKLGYVDNSKFITQGQKIIEITMEYQLKIKIKNNKEEPINSAFISIIDENNLHLNDITGNFLFKTPTPENGEAGISKIAISPLEIKTSTLKIKVVKAHYSEGILTINSSEVSTAKQVKKEITLTQIGEEIARPEV